MNINVDIHAVVKGQPVTDLPKDLYIPPEALKVFLKAFEGPLDLLLYLIKRRNLDILNIPIAEVTRQYMQYVEVMKEIHLELAAEYLVMAVMLAEIKSRMLLPRIDNDEDQEEDPRAELVRRLQEYERFKKVAESIDDLPRVNRDIFIASAELPAKQATEMQPQVELHDLWFALRDVLERAKMFTKHNVQRENLTVRERMSQILTKITSDNFTDFVALFNIKEGRLGVIVTFTAILELLRQATIELVQTQAYGVIYLKKVSG